MSAEERLRGSCSCGRYNYIIYIPSDEQARQRAYVHFGTGNLDRQSHASILSAWLRVPLTWYQSATVSFFPDESHDHIARTFTPLNRPSSQRKFCGFCGTHISYWTEQPASEQDFMNVTLGSLRAKDLLALEDLDLLPQDADTIETKPAEAGMIKKMSNTESPIESSERDVVPTAEGGYLQTSRSGMTGGISWFEDMIQGSRLGHHSKRRKGHGTSADGTTTISWEVSEYYGDDEDDGGEASATRAKRKAGEIEGDDTTMND